MSNRPSRRGKKQKRWVAAGTLIACAATGTGHAVVRAGQAPSPKQPQGERALPVFRFDIPAGFLGDALDAFEKAAGWKIETPDAGMRELQSKGISGAMPPAQALRQLLAGTGLTYRTKSPATAVLELVAVQSSVDVNDRVPLSSPRYTQPLRDLPQTVSVVPKEIIEQQGATSLTEVLRNVPGLTIAAGEGGTPAGDNLTLRGNSARNDIFIDGVRDLNPQSRDPFNIEQVEVTKGPTSVVSGRGSAGGTINLSSKLPSLMQHVGGSFAVGSADTRRATVDFNTSLRRLGLGERSAFRLNLLTHDAGVAGRNAVTNSRWGFAPSLAFGLGTPTRLILSYYKLKQDNLSDYGIPWVPATNNALAEYRDRPAPVPRDTFYGFRDRDREVLNQDSATVRFEHTFGDSTELRSQLRYGLAGRNSIATPPRFASDNSTEINREMRSWVAQDRIWDNQTDINTKLTTGAVKHTVVAGVAFTGEKNERLTRTAPNSPAPLLNPNPNDVYAGVITTSPIVGNVAGNTQSAWLFDTATFGKHWEVTGGGRFDRFDVSGINTAGAPVRHLVNMPSLRAALVFKPVERGSVYAAYGTSQSPSLEGLSYGTANTAIPPEKTYTAETGTKWEVLSRRLLLSGALFRVAKDNARTPGLSPTDPPQVLAGRQVSQGAEFSASGAITNSLRVLGSYTFIDARIRSSNNPLEAGKDFQNTPRNATSVWITYTARRFSFGLGPRFMGARYGNNTNTRRVESYSTIDAMASMRVNRFLDVRVNLSNLNDAYYFERLGGGHLIPGPSRYALFTTNLHF